MIVWRLETEEGTGIYDATLFADYSLHDATKAVGYDRHPNPVDEGLREGIDLDYSCGFSTLRQAAEWFQASEAMAWALIWAEARRGVLLTKYSVPVRYVMRGKYQVMFSREDARLERTYPVSKILDPKLCTSPS